MQTRLKSTFSSLEHVELLETAGRAALMLGVRQDREIGRVMRPADRVQEGALRLVHLHQGAHLAEGAPVLSARIGDQVLGQLVHVHRRDVLREGRAPVGAGRDHRHSGAGRHLPQELQLLLGPPIDGRVDNAAKAVGRGHAQLFGDQLDERLRLVTGKRVVAAAPLVPRRHGVGLVDVEVLMKECGAARERRGIDVTENGPDDGAVREGGVRHRTGRFFHPAAARLRRRGAAATAARGKRQAGPGSGAEDAERLAAREV